MIFHHPDNLVIVIILSHLDGSIFNRIILIDGAELAELMIDYNVGVSVIANYEIKRIDSDYFVEE